MFKDQQLLGSLDAKLEGMTNIQLREMVRSSCMNVGLRIVDQTDEEKREWTYTTAPGLGFRVEPIDPDSVSPRFVVLSPGLAQTLHDLLSERRRETLGGRWSEVPEFVFCSETGGTWQQRNVSRSWTRLRRKAHAVGVRPLRLHDARHTYASLAPASGKSVRWVASQLGHANPELTLRVYAHALREEETDLSFLDFGGAKRHPRGTKVQAVANKKTPPRLSGRGGFSSLEHETGFEPATLTLAT
jgi:hypothetical protein